MMALQTTAHLLQRLPADQAGRVQADAPLGKLTWFRVGGTAEVLVRPADAPPTWPRCWLVCRWMRR